MWEGLMLRLSCCFPTENARIRLPRPFTIGNTTLAPEDVEIIDGVGHCVKCDFTTPESRTMEGHVNREHKRIKPYNCNVCGQEFASKMMHLRHMKNVHGVVTRKARKDGGGRPFPGTFVIICLIVF
jgi:hypothetical protein